MDRVSAGKDEKEGSAVPENRKGFTAALHIRGLRQRWLLSATLPILLLLVLAVSMFSVGVQEYYYSAMRSGLESRARIAAETFSNYGVKSYSEYYRLASYSAETFEEKDTIELQFINTNGRVQVSSYGLTAGTLTRPWAGTWRPIRGATRRQGRISSRCLTRCISTPAWWACCGM